jgi:hypothetical protein
VADSYFKRCGTVAKIGVLSRRYASAIAAALDRGKTAIAAREKSRADLTIMFRLLGQYVEVACKTT